MGDIGFFAHFSNKTSVFVLILRLFCLLLDFVANWGYFGLNLAKLGQFSAALDYEQVCGSSVISAYYYFFPSLWPL